MAQYSALVLVGSAEWHGLHRRAAQLGYSSSQTVGPPKEMEPGSRIYGSQLHIRKVEMSNLLDFPIELFRTVIEIAVEHVGLRESVRLRQVNSESRMRGKARLLYLTEY